MTWLGPSVRPPPPRGTLRPGLALVRGRPELVGSHRAGTMRIGPTPTPRRVPCLPNLTAWPVPALDAEPRPRETRACTGSRLTSLGTLPEPGGPCR
jgi:hypothetical protein